MKYLFFILMSLGAMNAMESSMRPLSAEELALLPQSYQENAIVLANLKVYEKGDKKYLVVGYWHWIPFERLIKKHDSNS